MAHGFPLSGRPLYSILTALILFVSTQYLLVYREVSMLDSQKMDMQDTMLEKERELSELRMNLQTRDRELYRTVVRVKELEKRCAQRIKVTARASQQISNDRRIIFITPTYARPTQKADLIRLSHTLMLVANVFWIIVSDAEQPSDVVKDILARSSIPSVQLYVATPAKYKMRPNDPSWLMPKGVAQRNLALDWLRNTNPQQLSGVVYFGDDDNVYDLRLFNELNEFMDANVSTVGVMPVGLAGGLIVERPIVDLQTGKVTSWITGWKPERPFPCDMAGFAISSRLLTVDHPTANFSFDVPRGYLESHLLEQLDITLDKLVPLADKCRRVFVWHTRTEPAKLKGEAYLQNQGTSSHGGMIEL